ncbi:hypothetical protein AWI85_06105 [Listeria monocytogenes]|uniref:hypothetical protein n=1 Tax=Listeria monocytogenes TaxID=1639 RepID=UPI0007758F97|nr:hypothetical protein [Listeria monocytogenes]EAE0845940.1 hypothetical protein [Listeria monocytogenes]EAF8771705.1 hypothetical protein [Listeria monocytogenes]EEA6131032.1 hypothetical protein [Listeria monocytogenes]KXS79284.1 hypothetical protein AWI86_05395 [Listeria monocytogenes]KXS81572.1 hypothetical protein AWI85_06105 [Listeria monocytogenes]
MNKRILTYHLKNGESIKTTIDHHSLEIMKDSFSGKLINVKYNYFDEKSRHIYALDLLQVIYLTVEVEGEENE